MNIHNTEKKFKIKEIKLNNFKKVGTSILLATYLAGQLTGDTTPVEETAIVTENVGDSKTIGSSLVSQITEDSEQKEEFEVIRDEEFGYYIHQLNEHTKELDSEEFDEIFEQYYNSSSLNINGYEYDINTLYLKTMEDGKIVLVCSKNPLTDLLTGEKLGKNITIKRFKESTLFYNLYLDNRIEDGVIKISIADLSQYVNNWDGEEHSATLDLKATQMTEEDYGKRYPR